MKFFRVSTIGWGLFIALLVFCLGRVYFHAGFPYTHDGENHLARFANYKLALKEGQFPPRLAPNLLNRFTYPVFNFNYPLANIASLPFSFFKLNYELTFKILALGALGVAAVGSNLWLHSLGVNGGARRFALGALFSSPFLINIVWFRGNIGELFAIALFPVALWLTELWIQKSSHRQVLWGLGLGAIGILLAHNIAALMLTPLLIGYGLFVEGWKNKLKLLGVWLVAALSTLWFWLPALVEKGTIVLDKANFFQVYSQYFVTVSQLLTGPIEFGFAYSGSISSLNLSLGVLTFVVLLVSLVWGIVNWKTIAQKPRGVLLVVLCISLIYLQTALSDWLWKLIPILTYLQFPWRLTLPLIILMLPLFAFWWQWANHYGVRWLKVLLLVLLAFQFSALFKLTAVDYFRKTIVDYDAYSQTTSTLNENLPKDFRFMGFGNWQPTPTILKGAGTITVQRWSGTQRRYSLNLVQPSTIVEPSIVWLGFETTANNARVTYIDSDDIQGRLAYELPAGHYEIKTDFTQNSWARKTGNLISVLTILGTTSWLVWSYLYKKHGTKHS